MEAFKRRRATERGCLQGASLLHLRTVSGVCKVVIFNKTWVKPESTTSLFAFNGINVHGFRISGRSG